MRDWAHETFKQILPGAAGTGSVVGSVGDSYDNALAESIIGLYKAEVIRPGGRWRGVEAVEFATLEWVDWFNNRRILEPIGDRPRAASGGFVRLSSCKRAIRSESVARRL